MKISPARLAAFEILLKIETERAFSSNLLPIYEEDLSEKDRSLCHELTLGTLRRQLYLDRVIDHFSKLKRLDPAVKIAIRLGLYQLLFLDRVPDYSAINESVELVKRAKKVSAKGLVNAILRRATREKAELRFSDKVDQISVETSHPRWLIERWISEFGFDEAHSIAIANNNLPKMSFRTTCRTDEETISRLSVYDRSIHVIDCMQANRIDADLIDLEQQGLIYFQEESSQLVAASIVFEIGAKLLDVCASPGSKTSAIAARIRPFGAESLLIAGDVTDTRTDFLKYNCEKQGADNVRVVQYNALTALPFPDEYFDIVLVDAPCSGTGTIRHNPEIRYHLKEKDLKDLSHKQLEILQNASKVLKNDGALVYSTCSLEREENEDVCKAFLDANSGFVASTPTVPVRFIADNGFARIFPNRDDMDGFFIAFFRKRGI